MKNDNDIFEIFTDGKKVYYNEQAGYYREIPISDEEKTLMAKFLETYMNAPELKDMPFSKQWRERNK